MANKIICKCEYCGKDFETTDSVHGKRKRFCNKSCSAFWRNKTYGPNRISEETRLKNAELLKAKWKNDEFRERNIQRMKTNNPVYMDGVVAKANKTKLEKCHLPNNFKFGNGHISDYESKVLPQLASLNFYYNYAIPTKLARDAFPEKRFPP